MMLKAILVLAFVALTFAMEEEETKDAKYYGHYNNYYPSRYYNSWGYRYGRDAEEKDEKYISYGYSGYRYPYVGGLYRHHGVGVWGKRDAEKDEKMVVLTHGLHTPYLYRPFLYRPFVHKTIAHVPLIVKREAEEEKDGKFMYYRHYGHYPYYRHYGYGNRYYGRDARDAEEKDGKLFINNYRYNYAYNPYFYRGWY